LEPCRGCQLQFAAESKPRAKLAFDFSFVGVRVLRANPCSRDVARELVEVERDPETLLTCHSAVSGDLLVERGLRIHAPILLSNQRVSSWVRHERVGLWTARIADHRTPVRPCGEGKRSCGVTGKEPLRACALMTIETDHRFRPRVRVFSVSLPRADESRPGSPGTVWIPGNLGRLANRSGPHGAMYKNDRLFGQLMEDRGTVRRGPGGRWRSNWGLGTPGASLAALPPRRVGLLFARRAIFDQFFHCESYSTFMNVFRPNCCIVVLDVA